MFAMALNRSLTLTCEAFFLLTYRIYFEETTESSRSGINPFDAHQFDVARVVNVNLGFID